MTKQLNLFKDGHSELPLQRAGWNFSKGSTKASIFSCLQETLRSPEWRALSDASLNCYSSFSKLISVTEKMNIYGSDDCCILKVSRHHEQFVVNGGVFHA